jgi:hypothetical protein
MSRPCRRVSQSSKTQIQRAVSAGWIPWFGAVGAFLKLRKVRRGGGA